MAAFLESSKEKTDFSHSIITILLCASETPL